MSMRRSLAFSASIVLASLSLASAAKADPAGSVPAQTYSEQRTEGGAVVTFEKDDLRGGGPSALGDSIRRPPGAIRVGLIRPRYNFVPELLKSVENL
jgi:hypothetical protein